MLSLSSSEPSPQLLMLAITITAILFTCSHAHTTTATTRTRGLPQTSAMNTNRTLLTEDDIYGVVNGYTADWNDYPYIASVRFYDEFHCCGGSVISLDPPVILTAAHCVAPIGSPCPLNQVRIGCQTTECWATDNSAQYSAKNYTVQSSVYMPGWDDRTSQYDVALLYLTEAIDTPSNTQALTLSSAGTVCCSNDEQLRVFGYGKIGPVERAVEIQTGIEYFVPKASCVQAFSGHNVPSITDDMMCFKDTVDGLTTVCAGDSGSPIVKQSDPLVQVSLVSWGVAPWGICDADLPQVGANVGESGGNGVYQWIQQNVAAAPKPVGAMAGRLESNETVQARPVPLQW